MHFVKNSKRQTDQDAHREAPSGEERRGLLVSECAVQKEAEEEKEEDMNNLRDPSVVYPGIIVGGDG
jgi:hypothetical protein